MTDEEEPGIDLSVPRPEDGYLLCQAPGVLESCPPDDPEYYTRLCEECDHTFGHHYFDNKPGNEETEERGTRCAECYRISEGLTD